MRNFHCSVIGVLSSLTFVTLSHGAGKDDPQNVNDRYIAYQASANAANPVDAGAAAALGGTLSSGVFGDGDGNAATPNAFQTFLTTDHVSDTANFVAGFDKANAASVPAVLVITDTDLSHANNSDVAGLDPKQLYLHPGGLGGDPFANPLEADLRFTVVTPGVYTITGDFESVNSGNVTDRIRLNADLPTGSVLFSQDDSTSDPASFTLTRTLGVGDTIDFTVNANGNIGSDGTGFRANIVLAPEPGILGLIVFSAGRLLVRRRRA